jgi:hypothetical protein
MGSAMASEGQRRLSRVVLVPLLLAPLVLALWWISTRSERGPSHFDDVLDAALLPVMQQREVQQKLRTATATQARLLARELAQRSVPYLSPRDLELWAATRARVARASKPDCAHLWKGGDETFLGPAIAALGEPTLDSYVDMLARGLALRLEQKPPPSVSAGALDRGFAAIAGQLPAEARERFQTDVKRRDIGDDRACELFLTLSRGAEKLEPALRTDFYRALSGALEVDR